MASTDESIQDRLTALVEPELSLHGFELVELELLRGGRRLTLRFFIGRASGGSEGVTGGQTPDSASPRGGVTLGECAAMSRAISQVLDAEGEELLPGRYVIEVSSPGIFRRLKNPAHFQRHLGEMIKVVAVGDDGGTVQLRGRLTGANERGIELEIGGGEHRTVEHASIRRANLDPDLDLRARADDTTVEGSRRTQREPTERRRGRGAGAMGPTGGRQ